MTDLLLPLPAGVIVPHDELRTEPNRSQLKDTALGTGLFREEKKRIMAIAHEWLKLAGLCAKTSTGSGSLWASSGRSERRRSWRLSALWSGDLQGIAGRAMPEIPSLDMPLLEVSTDSEARAL